jgi:hypothetical protein
MRIKEKSFPMTSVLSYQFPNRSRQTNLTKNDILRGIFGGVTIHGVEGLVVEEWVGTPSVIVNGGLVATHGNHARCVKLSFPVCDMLINVLEG